jgi:hypothetical protein
MTAKDWPKFAPYFTPSEFRHPESMSYGFMMRLLALRKAAGVAFHIKSSARSKKANVAAGGAKGSAHKQVPCCAVDIGPPDTVDPSDPHWNRARFKILEAAFDHRFLRVGIIMPRGGLHLDIAPGLPVPRLWVEVSNKDV